MVFSLWKQKADDLGGIFNTLSRDPGCLKFSPSFSIASSWVSDSLWNFYEEFLPFSDTTNGDD